MPQDRKSWCRCDVVG